MGDIVFIWFFHMSQKELMRPKNWRTSHTLVGASIAWMESTLDDRGIILSLLTHDLRYSNYVNHNNKFSLFTVIPLPLVSGKNLGPLGYLQRHV